MTNKQIEEAAFLKYPKERNDLYNPTEDDNKYEREIFIDAVKWALSQKEEPIKGVEELILSQSEVNNSLTERPYRDGDLLFFNTQIECKQLILETYRQLRNEHLSEFMEPIMDKLEDFLNNK